MPELDGGGVSEIQTLAEFKLLFFKDGFPYLIVGIFTVIESDGMKNLEPL